MLSLLQGLEKNACMDDSFEHVERAILLLAFHYQPRKTLTTHRRSRYLRSSAHRVLNVRHRCRRARQGGCSQHTLQPSKQRMQFLHGENKRDLLPTVRFLEAELLAPKGLVTKSALQRLQDCELQSDLLNMEFWTDRRVRI